MTGQSSNCVLMYERLRWRSASSAGRRTWPKLKPPAGLLEAPNAGAAADWPKGGVLLAKLKPDELAWPKENPPPPPPNGWEVAEPPKRPPPPNAEELCGVPKAGVDEAKVLPKPV